MLYRQYN